MTGPSDRQFHADFEILSDTQLRMTLSEVGHGVWDVVEGDPGLGNTADRFLAAFLPLPQSAQLTVTCNFPFDHWRQRNRTLFCDEVVMAARIDLEQRRTKA